MLKVYAYKGCETCRKALKWLEAHGVAHEVRAIREQPPTVKELAQVLAARGELRSMFNTSGQDYRSMGMKEKLPTLSEKAALELLANHGNLVKRPLALDEAAQVFLVGFKEAEWAAALG
ncbi:MAG: arsenate reductase family protein [Verrucomicrobiales bacterium]|nr:arsenate reductase family protein [Verrucomicrobiales bacterium]